MATTAQPTSRNARALGVSVDFFDENIAHERALP